MDVGPGRDIVGELARYLSWFSCLDHMVKLVYLARHLGNNYNHLILIMRKRSRHMMRPLPGYNSVVS